MLNVKSIIEHAAEDHDVTRLTILIYPLPDDHELHLAISSVCIKAIEELLECKSLKPEELN